MTTRQIKRAVILFLGFLGLMLSFQNCSPPNNNILFNNVASKVSPPVAMDNGHPYDGKIFFLIGDVCADGSKIQARIVLKTSDSADLVRKDCAEIEPVALTANEFQVSPVDSAKLVYNNQTYISQLIGTKLDLTQFQNDGGFAVFPSNNYDFGNAVADSMNALTVSRLQLYEDGKPLALPHTDHQQIRDLGMGRYSHWSSVWGITLRFSATDNTDPLTNGRTYTWEIN